MSKFIVVRHEYFDRYLVEVPDDEVAEFDPTEVPETGHPTDELASLEMFDTVRTDFFDTPEEAEAASYLEDL